MAVDRRTFMKGAVGASGAALLGKRLAQHGSPGALLDDASTDVFLPRPAESGIEHVIVVMMENRSFDHFLGWLPHADGRQAGLAYTDPTGVSHPTYHQTQLNGCGFNDPDHSYTGGRIQYDEGRMDGFLTDTANDLYAIGYYEAKDRPFMSQLALHYRTCDRYFCAILAPTFPNRIFQHAAQTDRLENTFTVSTLPTIWDQLNQSGGPTGRYYYSDLPITALWGSKYLSISHPVSEFLSDAASGKLPNVAFVDPGFVGEDNGTSDDDHPLADIRAGDAFLSQIFHAVATGPGWRNTVLVINYDEWGGFFEHVVPRRVTPGIPIGASPSTGVDQDLVDGRVLTGFRVPCIVASPFTRLGLFRRPVAHRLFDHTSVLKLIEWRWGLQPLSQRDASRKWTDPGNLAIALDFFRPDTRVPDLPVLAPFTPVACATPQPAIAVTAPAHTNTGSAGSADREMWAGLSQLALQHGWG